MPSNAEFQAGNGTDAMPSSSGLPNERASRRASESSSPAYVQAIPQTVRRCSSSGNGGPGGTPRKAKKPPSWRGWAGMNSRYQRNTSAASARSYKTGPACTVAGSGCARKVKDVTTPKLPPPPRIAQNRSGSRPASVSTTEPSASTTVAAIRLSIVSPKPRDRCPTPPPSVRPPTPVVEITPAGTTSPCSAVAASTWPSFAPPCTCTVEASGSTITASICDRSITTPSSTLPSPPPLCPPDRIASRNPRLRANAIVEATSCSSAQYAIATGCLSIIALYNARASS